MPYAALKSLVVLITLILHPEPVQAGRQVRLSP
jgi:hypothetical protein